MTLAYKALIIGEYIVHHYDMVDSTSTVCQQRLYQGMAKKVAIVADTQSIGRGRLGSTWQSMQGNLMTTIVLPLEEKQSIWADFSFIVALAVSDTISELTDGARAEIKWSNDVLVGGAKVAGVLLEAYEKTLCIGVGLNIVSAPVVGKYSTTCLSALGANVDKMQVLELLLQRIDVWRKAWDINGLNAILPSYKARLKGVGQPICMRTINDTYTGVFKGIDENGQAVLTMLDGSDRTFSAGEMSFE